MGTCVNKGDPSDELEKSTEFHSKSIKMFSPDNPNSSKVKKQAPNPRVLIIQNDVLCPPASAISSLVEHEIAYQVIYAFHLLAFKNIEPLMYEAIIVLGGRCSVNDAPKIQWLSNEMDFIKQALTEKVPILGICLGAQLLAACTGGEVIAGDKGIEIGFEDWMFADDDDDEKHNLSKCEMDPFIRALKQKDLDKFIILFHGDTFNLPEKCELSGQNIDLLAKTKTKKYKTLYKVGEQSYGFQGHPELNYDLIQIWSKSWGDDWLKKSGVDLENDVLSYAKKNKKLIEQNSKILFDIWIDIALLCCVPKITPNDWRKFDRYSNDHWNDILDEQKPVTYSGFFGSKSPSSSPKAIKIISE